MTVGPSVTRGSFSGGWGDWAGSFQREWERRSWEGEATGAGRVPARLRGSGAEPLVVGVQGPSRGGSSRAEEGPVRETGRRLRPSAYATRGARRRAKAEGRRSMTPRPPRPASVASADALTVSSTASRRTPASPAPLLPPPRQGSFCPESSPGSQRSPPPDPAPWGPRRSPEGGRGPPEEVRPLAHDPTSDEEVTYLRDPPLTSHVSTSATGGRGRLGVGQDPTMPNERRSSPLLPSEPGVGDEEQVLAGPVLVPTLPWVVLWVVAA